VEKHIDTQVYRQALDEVLARYPNDKTYLEMAEFYKKQNE